MHQCMRDSKRHIISSLHWQTRFDRQDKATELQDRLCAWTNKQLYAAVQDVFDRTCPTGKILSVKRLELDLGKIDYYELEFELGHRIKRALYEKLTTLLIADSSVAKEHVQLLEEKESLITILASYLLSGIMPWNHTQQNGINEVLTILLKEDNEALVTMVRREGVHAVVRKRLAWQLMEPKLKELIHSLEPANHEQITNFNHELNKVQEEENLVQAERQDFKRSVWEWILAYLLVDQSSVFNMVALMKSTIKQMAAHYNISYEDLLQVMQQAVVRMGDETRPATGFLAALKILLQESAGFDYSENLNEKATIGTGSMDALSKVAQPAGSLLRIAAGNNAAGTEKNFGLPAKTAGRQDVTIKDSLRGTALEKSGSSISAEINPVEYIKEKITIGDGYEKPLSNLIQDHAIGKGNPILFQAANTKEIASEDKDVDAGSEGILKNEKNKVTSIATCRDVQYFMAGAASSNEDATVGTYGFSAIKRAGGKSVSIPDLIKRFLPGAAIPQRESIKFIVLLTHAAGLHLNPSLLLEKIVAFARKYPGQPVPGRAFLIYCLDVVAEVNKLDRLLVLEKLMSSPVPGLVKGVAGANIYAQLTTVWMEASTRLKPLHSQLPEWLEALAMQLSSPIPAKQITVQILSQLKRSIAHSPVAAFTALTGWGKKDKLQLLIPYFLDEQLVNLFWRLPQVREYWAAIHLPPQYKQQPNTLLKEFFIRSIITQEQLHQAAATYKIGQNILEEINLPGAKNKAIFNIEKILLSIDNHIELSSVLELNFKDKDFVHFRENLSAGAADLLNYLLLRGALVMEELVKSYSAQLTALKYNISEREIIKELRELFWRIAISYNAHKGNEAAFRRNYHLAVMLRFPFTVLAREDDLNIQPSSEAETTRFTNGGSITTSIIFELVEKGLATGLQSFKLAERKYSFSQLLQKSLEISPARVKELIRQSPLPDNRLEALLKLMPFSRLSLSFISDSYHLDKEPAEAIWRLYIIAKKITPGRSAAKLLQHFRSIALRAVRTGENPQAAFQKMVSQTLCWLEEEKPGSIELIARQVAKHSQWMVICLREALVASHKVFDLLTADSPTQKLLQAARKGLLEDLINDLLKQGKLPAWYGQENNDTAESLLKEILLHYPRFFVKAYKTLVMPVKQLTWLRQAVAFSVWRQAIIKIHPAQQSKLEAAEKLYITLGRLSISGIAPGKLQQIIQKKVINAWVTGKFNTITPTLIWNELIWDAHVKYNISRQVLVQALLRHKQLFSPALQQALKKIADMQQPALPKKTPATLPAKQPATGIMVHNAGLVLLHSYFILLLQRMGLLTGNRFTNDGTQVTAMHCLQFLATGFSYTEEALLPLNKVLCGIPLETPVTPGIDMDTEKVEIIEGLLNAVIGHWPAIGACSVGGFRGNWLVRDGVLHEEPERWVLTVEKRAYDVLISRSPFSFSIIKFAWMPKCLQVNWAF